MNGRQQDRLQRKLLLGFVALAVLLAGWAVNTNFKAVAAPRPKVTKHVRLIQHHSIRHVCSEPAKGRAQCMAEITVGLNGKPLTGAPSSSGSYGPAQFHIAYQLPCTPGGSVASICSTPSSYGPETIAIVDAGNFSSGVSGLVSSLDGYDQYYGLPACSDTNGCLSVINQSGATSPLPADAGWSGEIALDVETAHMVCQTCKIALVEANNDYGTDLAAANVTAASLDPVAISNSWSSNTDDPSLDSDFTHTGIAEVAATGDNGTAGNGASWPADIPEVVAASGTTLQINTDNTWADETVWQDSGGGCSDYYSAPSWQTGLSDWASNGCGSYRAFGDISADGDPDTGMALNINGTWYQAGGTSLSSPLIASMFALAGGIPSGSTASSLLYSLLNSSNSHDITSGDDCTAIITVNCTAATGFDTPSGLGSPNGIGGFSSLLAPPTNLTVSDFDQNQIKLSWSASSSSDVSGYYVYRNGSKIATVDGTNYTDSGLNANTAYAYYVEAYDSSSNISGPSIATGAITYYPEDVNEDGHINLLDLSLLASKYGKSGSGVGRSDINNDGAVNLLDLSLLASKYGSE